MISYSQYITRFNNLAKNTSTTTNTIGAQLINDSLRYLTTKFFFNERSYSVPGGTVSGTAFYNTPPQLKELINVTVTIGSVLWQPKPCPTREFWDALHTQAFNQDFPSYFFLYNGQVGIWPTPASNGNAITMNYQIRLTDISQADYTTGSVSVTTATNTVTGAAGATWTPSMVGRWIQIAENSTSSTTSGDNNWYQIATVPSTTSLTLTNNYTGGTVTGGSYIIGEIPILAEDHQDLALYRALWIYFTSRVPNPTNAKLYKELYDEGYKILDAEFGQKTTNVTLQDTDMPIANPNLFIRL